MKKYEEKEVDEYGFYKGKDLIGPTSKEGQYIRVILVIAVPLITLYILFNLFESKPKSNAELEAEKMAETERLKVINNLSKCKELEKKLNVNWTMSVSQEFVDLDCDSVIGASTREERVNEIRDAFRGY